MSDAPSRWSQGNGDVPPGMHELLESARRDLPNAAQLSALENKLGALLDAPPPAAAPPTPAPASTIPGATKLAVLVAVGGLLGAGAWWMSSGDVERPDASPQGVESAKNASVEGKPSTPAPRAEAAPRAIPEPAAEQAPADDTTAQEASSEEPDSRAQKVPSAAKKPSEAALLDQARRSLKTNPEHALALTRTHQRLFPKGALIQEREVIAIEALKRMDQTVKAQQKADRFGEQYPESAHQKKIDTTLEK